MFHKTKRLSLVVLMLVPGCENQTLAPSASERATAIPRRLTVNAAEAEVGRIEYWNPSGREKLLIDSLVARYPAPDRPKLLNVLTKRGHQLNLRSDPVGAKMLNEIYALRFQAIRAQAGPPPREVEATVALVDRLPVENAAAVIVRRANEIPHDVLLLPSSNATPESLAGAVYALYQLRDRDGDVPTRDMRLSIEMPQTKPTLRDPRSRVFSDIAELRSSAPRTIAGIGRVKAIEIPLLGSEAKK